MVDMVTVLAGVLNVVMVRLRAVVCRETVAVIAEIMTVVAIL
ncbi:Uncharacterised protein [Shigella boydii]|uniref:Uncharacterized protein n=1 Tax=Shigella boydii TaxID=621 RepID=A0A2X2JFX1_SHIBO|nr:Uncharacterised protein [Shigella boydii]